MLTILINAYACAPNKGSEPGMAWNWINHLSEYCKLHVITEGEWRSEIEAELPKQPFNNNITFYYLPVSTKVRSMCWNQGDWRFYFYYKQWQKKALNLAKEIVSNNHIDILHQLNMIGFREPGYLFNIKEIPFIWGPIGGMSIFPEAYIQGAGFQKSCFIKIKNKINKFQIKHSRRVKNALHNAQTIIAATTDEVYALKKFHNIEALHISETGCFERVTSTPQKQNKKDTFEIVWVGKFDLRKQLLIALKAIALLDNKTQVRFHVIGTGSEKENTYYQSQAQKLGISQHINWHGAIPNKNVLDIMQQSDVFLFTSVAEATSTVVLEALSCELPVICFDACGFASVIDSSVGIKVPLSTPEQSAKDFASAIEQLRINPQLLQQLSNNCKTRQRELSWHNKAKQMHLIYEQILKSNK